MHAFWHAWVKKKFSFFKALESEWWWFDGEISEGNITAWYDGKAVFIVISKDMNLMKETKKELKTFVRTFSGVRS